MNARTVLELQRDQRPPRLATPRPAHHLLRDVVSGAESLHKLVAGWQPLLPSPGDLAAAQRTVEGLRRVLSDLGQHVPGGPNDYAA